MDRPARDVIRPGPDDIEWMTALLTRAFLVEAPTTHLFLGPHRERQVRYFMRCSVAYAAHFGECHATDDRRGVALWLLPGATAMTPARMRVAGMFSAPWRMGPRAFLRFMGFAAHTTACTAPRFRRRTTTCSRSASILTRAGKGSVGGSRARCSNGPIGNGVRSIWKRRRTATSGFTRASVSTWCPPNRSRSSTA